MLFHKYKGTQAHMSKVVEDSQLSQLGSFSGKKHPSVWYVTLVSPMNSKGKKCLLISL